jgi:transposase
MKQYVGLDVSMGETKIHVLDEEGERIWRGKCRSEPGTIAATIHKHASEAVRIGIETGPLTTWLYTELVADGLPMVCLDARALLCFLTYSQRHQAAGSSATTSSGCTLPLSDTGPI